MMGVPTQGRKEPIMATREILIVENETEATPQLQEIVHDEAIKEPTHFTLVVPATPPHGSAMWSEGQARIEAEARLRASLRALRVAGADIDGKVGAHRAYDAVNDELLARDYDAVIVTSPPGGITHPFRGRLAKSIRRHYDIPVINVPGSRTPLHHDV
jgi:hypothetical protein